MTRTTPPPRIPCPPRAPHEGRAYGRGWSAGVRMLRDALAAADLDRAQEIIEMAEARATERGGRRE